jgi:hypothetical protein
VVGELCCNRTTAQYNRVFSLIRDDSRDHLVTTDVTERDTLVKSGHWREVSVRVPFVMVARLAREQSGRVARRGPQVCASSSADYGTSYFCYTPLNTSFEARTGPFLLYAVGDVPAEGYASLLDSFPRQPLYRCSTEGGFHFLSTSVECAGGRADLQLGFVATQPSTAMPRMLRDCTQTNGVHYHTTDALCLGQDTARILGYVG